MKIKLALFDIDGTLVTHESHILLDSTVEAIHRLQEKGIKVAIASGRTQYALDKAVLERVEFDYLISSNGASVYDVSKNQYLYLQQYEKILVDQLLERIKEVDGGLIFQYSHAGYCYVDYEGFGRELMRYLGLNESELIDFTQFQNMHHQQLPNHILARIPDQSFEFLKEEFKDLSFVRFLPEFYDVNAGFINKSFGLGFILEALGLEADEVIAFGDGQNDIEMLSHVGISVAMGNADENIKAIADYVTINTDKGGIKQGLVHFGLIEDF